MLWKETSENTFSINLEKSSKPSRRLAASKSFPSYLLRYSLDLSPKLGLLPCSADIEGEQKYVSVMQQIDFVRKSLENPYRGNYLMIIGVDDVETRAQTLAAAIMLQAIDKTLENPHKYEDVPLWYPVYGGYKDKLRDNAGGPNPAKFSMLILTNVAENSTREKLEKVRDLLHMYSHLPRIVVYAGGSPLQWAKQSLHIRPTRVVYLGNRRKHVEKQI